MKKTIVIIFIFLCGQGHTQSEKPSIGSRFHLDIGAGLGKVNIDHLVQQLPSINFLKYEASRSGFLYFAGMNYRNELFKLGMKVGKLETVYGMYLSDPKVEFGLSGNLLFFFLSKENANDYYFGPKLEYGYLFQYHELLKQKNTAVTYGWGIDAYIKGWFVGFSWNRIIKTAYSSFCQESCYQRVWSVDVGYSFNIDTFKRKK